MRLWGYLPLPSRFEINARVYHFIRDELLFSIYSLGWESEQFQEFPLGLLYYNGSFSAGQEPMWRVFQLLSVSNAIKCSEAMKIISVWVGRLIARLWNGLEPRVHLSPGFSSPSLTRVSWWCLLKLWYNYLYASGWPPPVTNHGVCTVFLFVMHIPLRQIGGTGTICYCWGFVGFLVEYLPSPPMTWLHFRSKNKLRSEHQGGIISSYRLGNSVITSWSCSCDYASQVVPLLCPQTVVLCSSFLRRTFLQFQISLLLPNFAVEYDHWIHLVSDDEDTTSCIGCSRI